MEVGRLYLEKMQLDSKPVEVELGHIMTFTAEKMEQVLAMADKLINSAGEIHNGEKLQPVCSSDNWAIPLDSPC